MAILTKATTNQTISPKKIGLTPVLSIFLKSALKPIADNAITIMNLPKLLRWIKVLPLNKPKVFNKETARNHNMNQGNILFRLKFTEVSLVLS